MQSTEKSQESQALQRTRQEDCHEYETSLRYTEIKDSLGYLVRHLSSSNNKDSVKVTKHSSAFGKHRNSNVDRKNSGRENSV